MDDVANEHLRFWPEYFAVARPRTLNFNDHRPPALIFTDRAEEECGVGVGGIMLDVATEGKEFFGGAVESSKVEPWKAAGKKKRVIHQAEVYPAVVTLSVWGQRLKGRRIIAFVDNDAAKEALIKGTSSSKASARLVTDFWRRAAEMELYIWIERVASIANPADAPSRRACPELVKAGYKQRKVSDMGVRSYE